MDLSVVHPVLAGGAMFASWTDGGHRAFFAGGSSGSADAPGSAVLLEYDGAAWKFLRTSTTSSAAPGALRAVFGLSPRDLVIAGENSLVLRLVGDRIEKMDLGDDGVTTITGLWGSGEDDLWAVGGGIRAGDTTALPRIFHYDGTRWTAMTLDDGLAGRLLSVWGSSSADVWAVGQMGLVLHFDGARWSRVTSGAIETLTAVAGTSSTRVYAVGGDTRPVILSWNGSAFRELKHPLRSPLLSIAPYGDGFLISGQQGLVAAGDPEDPMILDGLDATTSVHTIVPLSVGGALLAGGNLFDPGRRELHSTIASIGTAVSSTFAGRTNVVGASDLGTAPPPPSVTGGGGAAW